MRSARLALAFAYCAVPCLGTAQSWQLDYDADLATLPSAQGWTHVVSDPLPADGLNEGNYLVALGALTHGDTGGPNADPANRQSYEIATVGMDHDADVLVVEARLRILASTMTPPGGSDPSAGFAIQIVDKDRDRIALYVGATGVFLEAGSAIRSTLVSFDTTSGFADYRLRIDRNGVRLFVDGAEVESLEREQLEWINFAVTANRLSFGDIEGGQSSSSQLEYIRVRRFEPPAAEVRDYQVVTELSATNSSGTKSLTVSCPTGTNALGGGVSAIGADGSVGIRDSRPANPPLATSWYGAAREFVDTSASWQLRVDAICGEISGYEAIVLDPPLATDRAPTESLACPVGKLAFSGGAGVIGADLRQVLTRSRLIIPGFDEPTEWSAAAHDFGAGSSSASSWALRTAAVCSDASGFEIVRDEPIGSTLPTRQGTALCPTGKVPIGGGASIPVGLLEDAALHFSRPLDGAPGQPPVGWIAEGQATTSFWSFAVNVVCAPIADPTVTKNSLVGRWEGEYGAYDSWGIRHGTLENGVGFAPGIRGQAFEFDPPLPEVQAKPWVRVPSGFLGGGDPYLRIDPPYLYPEASMTVDAWIVTDTLAPSDYTAVVSVYDIGGVEPNPNCSTWQITLTPEGYGLGAARPAVLSPCASAVTTDDFSLADGLPHHLAVRRDSELRRLALYVDGELQAETTMNVGVSDGPLVPSTFPGDPMAIGAWRAGTSTSLIRAFDGLIDDVKYYDRALTQEEIQNEAGCGLPLVPRVLNLDASRFGRKPGADGGLCVFLEAGSYTLTLTRPELDSAARFTAWSPSAVTPWSTVFVADPESGADVVGGFPTGSATPDDAFDDTLDLETTLTVGTDQRVYLSLLDETALDNRGGVSIRIAAITADTDGDTIDDSVDNCVFRANPTQSDANGNGAGDACECGDISGPSSQPDGLVDGVDDAALRDFLAAITSPPQAVVDKCSVIGGADDCDIRDWTHVARFIALVPPGLSQVCRAAVGP